MAATLASLGFDISTGGIKGAIKALDKLDKQSGNTEKSASKFSRGYSASMAAAKKGTLALTAATVGLSAAIIKYTNDGLENIDVLAKLARAQNATADGIRAVQIAAGDAGLDGMAASLTRLTRRLGAAEMGNKEYGDTVKALGLDIGELGKLDADEKIASIADAVSSSGLSMEETARHLQNLGFEQSNANAFFRQGGDAVRNARSEVEDYGLSLSAIDTAKVEAANDAWSRTSLATEAATNQLAIGMVPVIQTVAQYLNNAAKEGGGLSDSIESGVDIGVKGFAYLADVVAGFGVVVKVLGKSIAAGMLGAEAAVLSMALTIADKPISAINSLISAMNSLTGSAINLVGGELMKNLERDAISANMAFQEAQKDIHETLMKPLPSGGILAHYEEVKKTAHESAVVVVAAEKKANNERAKNSKIGGDEAGENFAKSFESSTKSIGSSLQDAITSGDWSGIGSTIGGAISGGIANTVSQQLTGAGSILAGVGGAIAGGIAGAAINSILNGGNSTPAYEKRQGNQSSGSVFGDINAKSESIKQATESTSSATSQLVGINRSMLQALNNVGVGIQNSSATISRALIDNVIKPGEFSRGTIDSGISIGAGTIGDLSSSALASQTIEYLNPDYALKQTGSETIGAGDEINRALTEVYAGLRDTVVAGAEVFGIGQDIVNSFELAQAELSLLGMTAEEQAAALEDHFSKVFDDLSGSTIKWLDGFQVAGEGLGETLARVANSTQVAQEAASQLGFQFDGLSGEALAEASMQLVEFTGGIENLASSMSGFITNFASDAQQFEITQNSLTSAFEQANLIIPETRQGYYDLLQAQDGTTAAGAENIATLLRVQSTASDYYQSLEDGADSALAVQEANLNTLAASQAAALSASQSAASAVDRAISGLSNPNMTAAMSRQSALSSLSSAAQSGNISSIVDLDRTLASATNISASEFASFGEYVKELSRTGGVLAGVKGVADAKVTKDQKLLSNIEKEIAAMTEQLVELGKANVKQSAKTARILERIEIDGVEVKA